MFPFRTTGELVFFVTDNDSSCQLMVSKIAAGLTALKARDVRVVHESVTFNGGLLRLVLSTNLLVAISKGRVSVHTEPGAVRVSYELWFTELLLAALMGGAFLGTAGAMGAGLSWSTAVILGATMFLLFFMGNWLVARARFRAFLSRCVGVSS